MKSLASGICPFCGKSPVRNELCPGTCGSLEGLDDDSGPDPGGRTFGYDWSKGYVAPFLGVDMAAAHDALWAANVSSATRMVDLGCGDGRICRAAAELGSAQAVGYDLDVRRIGQANDQTTTLGSKRTVSFHVGDLFQVDTSRFNLVTVFLLPETLSNPALVCKLQAVLELGGQVVSFGWKIPSLGEPVNCNGPVQLDGSAGEYSGLVKRWFLYG